MRKFLLALTLTGCLTNKCERENPPGRIEALHRHRDEFVRKMKITGPLDCSDPDGLAFPLDCDTLISERPAAFRCYDNGCSWVLK